MKLRFISSIALALSVLAAAGYGDTVFLKNGKKLEGRVVKKDGFVEVHSAQQVVKVAEDMIDRVATESGSTAKLLKSRQGASWRVRYEQAMRRKVDLDFADTPASDVFEFLREWSGLNILVAPGAADIAREKLITLKVNAMEFKTALQWVLRLSRLHMTLKDQAIYITDQPDQERELRAYDVRDLMMSIRDQQVSSVTIGGSGGGGLSGLGRGGGGNEEDYDMPQRAADLLRLIVTIVEPTSWGYAFISGAGEDSDIDIGNFF